MLKFFYKVNTYLELKTINPDAVSVYEKIGFREIKKRMRLELV